MMRSLREWNKRNIDNYIEIYIKSDIKKIIKLKKKKIYHLKKKDNIVGLGIKPEFPKEPDIIINNNFRKDTKNLSNNIIKKIIKL